MLMTMKLGLAVAYRYDFTSDDQNDRYADQVWIYLHIWTVETMLLAKTRDPATRSTAHPDLRLCSSKE